jgi:protein O-mannosyl-transferase
LKSIEHRQTPRKATNAALAHSSLGLHAALFAGLAIAASIAFSTSFKGVFVFDDEGVIVNSNAIKSLWPIWKFFARNNPRPIVDLTLAFNYAIGGLKSPPIGYHVVNLTIHVLAALFLFDIISRTLLLILNAANLHRSASLIAFAIALPWTVHPLQTQAVTYLVQRSESIMGLCFLLTLHGVLVGHGSKSPWRWYAVSLLACAIGMGTKVVLVAAPVVVICYDYLFLCSSWIGILRRRGWYYAALVGVIVFSLYWTGLFNSILNPNPGYEVTVGFGIKNASPITYLATQAGVILHYLRLCVWPASLCVDYSWPTTKSISEAAVCGVPLLTLLGLTLVGVARRRPWAFIGVWFFGVLAPSSSFIPVKDSIMEHRMYLPLAAMVGAVVLMNRWALTKFWPASSGLVGGVLLIAVTIALSVRTLDRNRVYHSPQAFWKDVIDQQPHSARAWVNYGESLTRVNQISEAIDCYRKAGTLAPESHDAFYNLGNAFHKIGAMDDAEKAYVVALQLSPKDLNSLIMLGNVYMSREQTDKAEAQFRAAIAAADRSTDPFTLAKAHYNLGNTLARLGRLPEALSHYQQAVQTAPQYDKAIFGLGWCYEQFGQRDEALKAYQECLRNNPQNTEANRSLQQLERTMAAERQAGRTSHPTPNPLSPNAPSRP